MHSAFNLITTFILLPFCNQLEKLAVITVRDKRLKPGKQDPHAVLLDERLLLSPSFAIAECRNATTKMANLVRDTILDAIGLLSHFDSATAEKIEKNEETSPRPTATMFRSCCIPSAISSVSATTR